MNAQIGSTILYYPKLGKAYRIKLPASINLQDAAAYYATRPEVQATLPAINYETLANDPINPSVNYPQQTIGLPETWQFFENQSKTVGSHRISVAVIDQGMTIHHPDLLMNIGLNYGEIPIGIRSQLKDMDPVGAPDGVISMRDLNIEPNKSLVLQQVSDVNSNGLIDGQDLISSAYWNDGDGDDDNNYPDDIVGWNFLANNNDTSANDQGHATAIAGILGADGNNNKLITGINWRTSIVPMVTAPRNSGSTSIEPDVVVLEAMQYAEERSVDIVNLSVGYHAYAAGANVNCEVTGAHAKRNIPLEPFLNAKVNYVQAFQVEPFVDSMLRPKTKALYVIAAGNNNVNLDDTNVWAVLAEPIKAVFKDHAVIVGNANPEPFNQPLSSIKKESDSNFGRLIDLWSPGAGWISLSTNLAAMSADCPGTGTFCVGSATSFATPAVTGTAALLQWKALLQTGQRVSPSTLYSRLLAGSVKDANITPAGGCPGQARTMQPRLSSIGAIAQ